jgi:DNA-binding MarR family transcriptional regulator
VGRTGRRKTLSVRDVQQVAEFRIALRGFLARTEEVARGSGLTPQRYLLLLMIKGSPAGDEQATVSELSKSLQLAQSTVTELVDRAERAGLLTRTTSADDARVTHIRLTDEGERRFAAAFRALADERRALRGAVAQLDE